MPAEPTYKHLNPAEVQDKLEAGRPLQLVDVRTPAEYAQHHIAEATLLPLDTLGVRWRTDLDPGAETVCLCEHGVRSEAAARFLAQQGFTDVATMTGGMAAYPGPVKSGLD